MQVFHLGYPKSGSTTIQQLLADDPGINFLGKPFRSPEAEYMVREHLPFSDLRQLPSATVERIREVLCTGHPIISDEILSGVGFAHGIASNSLLQILDNIELLTGGDFVAHVVLRQPAGFIRSYYGQIARMGGRITFEQFCSLVLLRRHHWVFQALNYRAILQSRHVREGRLRPVLFESLFHDKGLGDFMRTAFGSTSPPEAPETVQANPSDSDSVLDYAAPRHPINPAIWIELQVTEPSIQEYTWMQRLPPEEQGMHWPLWAEQRERALRLRQRGHAMLEETRRALGGHRGKRPPTPMFRQLVAAIAEVNAGVADDFPAFDFARHRYFETI